MATVNKNFRIKNGLVVEGSTATVNGNNILTENASDQYILNLIGGETLVKSVDTALNVDGSGKLSINRSVVDTWYDAAGAADAAETAANNYTNSAISTEVTNRNNAISTAKSEAISASETYTDNAISQEVSDRNSAISTAITNLNLSGTYDAKGAATTAENNAKSYTDTKISQEVTDRNNAISSAISTEVSDRNSAISSAIATEVTNRNDAIATALSTAEGYTDTAVANLVDGAPALLNTLNELAAAIADNPNYATDVANLVSTKADTTYVDSQDASTLASAKSYTDSAISTEISNRNSAISTALSTAESYTDSAISTEVTNRNSAISSAISQEVTDRNSAISTAVTQVEQYADSAVSNGNLNAEPAYKGVKLGYYTELVSGWASTNNGSSFVPLSWNTNAWGTAKLTVHVRSGIHTQASEVLVARDSNNNLHITEYAIVTTNGILADVSVSISGSNTQISVTPTSGHDQTEAVVSGSIIAWAD